MDNALLDGGYDLGTAVQLDESAGSGTLTVSGPSPDPTPAELTFLYVHDGGDFMSCFGFCLRSGIDDDVWAAVTAPDPATDDEQREFARQCVAGGEGQSFEVFNDVIHDPGDETRINITAPAEIIMFLVPDDRIPTFASNVTAFWDSGRRRPLFSLLGANPDCEDQMVLYNNGPDAPSATTLFLWEDKTRKNGSADSDEDFGDLVFRVNARIEPRVVTNTTHLCRGPGDADACTEAEVTSDTNTATISWGPDGLVSCPEP